MSDVKRPDWADDKVTEHADWQDVPEHFLHWVTDQLREQHTQLEQAKGEIERQKRIMEHNIDDEIEVEDALTKAGIDEWDKLPDGTVDEYGCRTPTQRVEMLAAERDSLKLEGMALAAHQCQHPGSDEYGNAYCVEIDRLNGLRALLCRWLLLTDKGHDMPSVIVEGEKLIVETKAAIAQKVKP